jgi:hypothetical protein
MIFIVLSELLRKFAMPQPFFSYNHHPETGTKLGFWDLFEQEHLMGLRASTNATY